jgi:hypothetical protein
MSLPRELHEVLEQEYVSMYGPLPAVDVLYTSDEDVTDERWASAILRTCGLAYDDLSPATVRERLNEYITSRPPRELLASPAITSAGRSLLEQYNVMNDEATDEGRDLRSLNRRIVDEAFSGAVKALRDVRLKNVYDALHARAIATPDEARSALCISGGGIRSATFALGVIQGLASAKLLAKFDYLSTVSGGGYVGAWLSSWTRRNSRSLGGVQETLACTDTGVGGSRRLEDKADYHDATKELAQKIDNEPKPVRHLREYSNYLSPRLGLLSADAWTMAAHYMRNLLLNLLVLVPILAAVLAIPRAFAAVSLVSNQILDVGYAYAAAAFLTWAFAYIGLKRPVDGGASPKWTKMSGDTSYIVGCILPLSLAAASLALFWTDYHVKDGTLEVAAVYFALWWALAAMTIFPVLIYYVRVWQAFRRSARMTDGANSAQLKHLFYKGMQEAGGAIAGMAAAIGLLLLLAYKVFDDPMRTLDAALVAAENAPVLRAGYDMTPWAAMYTCFAVPAILLVFYVQASIFVGFSSRRNEEYDREWWGRAGAWLLIAAGAWAVLSGITVFGPIALYHAPVLLASIGGVSGVAAAILGFSAKTPANKKEKDDAGTVAKAGNAALGFAVPLFVIFFLAMISLGTTWLTWQLKPLVTGEPKLDFTQYAFAAQMRAKVEGATEVPNAGTLKHVSEEEPLISIPLIKSLEHLRTLYNTSFPEVGLLAALALAAWGISFLVGVNKFSMHALYRNRLVRAYLGASRYSRNPHPFTGFDEKDDLRMHQLRPELLWPGHVIDTKAFLVTFKEASTHGIGDLTGVLKQRRLLAQHLWTRFYDKTRKQILNSDQVTAQTIDLVVQNINTVLADRKSFFKEVEDLRQELKKENIWALEEDPKKTPYPVVMQNRAIFDHCFREIVVPMPLPRDEAAKREKAAQEAGEKQWEQPRRPPMHVVNMALNLVGGEKLAWQQRMAESFTASPYHSGSLYLGYRDSHEYGGAEGISVGTAVTISGAAASPNMGYHSSPALAFLLTLFNIRLGWWLGNPGPVGQKSYRNEHPSSNLAPILAEATAQTNDRYQWVYLSDGGHFENLGMYEMVLRRCHNIVLSDAGADPKFIFDDLGNAIRKIRTDLGVPVELEHMYMFPRSAESATREWKYVATGKIRYRAVDGEKAKDGTLIYIKPGVYDDKKMPRDVYNYAQGSPEFPHEPTSDQFFSESQFESYRALGRHAMNDICHNYGARIPIATQFDSVDEFARFVAGEMPPHVLEALIAEPKALPPGTTT